MSTALRVSLFAAALAGVLGVSWGLGSAVGPVGAPVPAGHDTGHDAGHDAGAAAGTQAAALPGGLQVTDRGYTLALAQPRARAGRTDLAFTVLGPEGHPVRDYDEQHERRLHLIAVRRDFTGYQHVHPTLAQDGTWTVPLDLSPGTWRVFADFTPTGGPALTLGADLAVPGSVAPAPPAPETTRTTVGGYTVALVGDRRAGDLTVEVSRGGEPVTDLEPYLGAYGHLVALREGDLAYLHVHPEDGDAGPRVPFTAHVPGPGGYRLFFDFRHDGVVRTAELTMRSQPDEH